MNTIMKNTLFGSPSNRSEAKLDTTGRIARDIVAQDKVIRQRNMERLRAARLARDAAEPPALPAIGPDPKRRKKTAS